MLEPELQLINIKPMIKNKLKEWFGELKKFKVEAFKDEAFKYIYLSIMTNIKSYVCKDWIVLNVIIKLSIKIFASI